MSLGSIGGFQVTNGTKIIAIIHNNTIYYTSYPWFYEWFVISVINICQGPTAPTALVLWQNPTSRSSPGLTGARQPTSVLPPAVSAGFPQMPQASLDNPNGWRFRESAWAVVVCMDGHYNGLSIDKGRLRLTWNGVLLCWRQRSFAVRGTCTMHTPKHGLDSADSAVQHGIGNYPVDNHLSY